MAEHPAPSLSCPPCDAPASPLIRGLLALTVLIAVGLKLCTASAPVARDVMLYTTVGHEMIEGRELYSDLFEHKPPLFLTIFGLANAVAGYGKPAILLLNLICAIATLGGVYYSAKHLANSAWAGLFAAAAWALVSNDINLHAHQPMPECFINASMIWAFGLFLRLDGRSLQVGRCLAIGALLMIASQVKQPAVFIAAGWAFIHLITKVSEPGERRRRFAQVAIIASVGALTWAGLFAYFAAVGRFQAFYDANFTYNKHYAGLDEANGSLIQSLKIIWWNLNNGFLPRRLFPVILLPLLPLVLASLVAAPLGLIRSSRRAWLLWLVYFAATFLVITTPGRGYNHYYIIYLPVFIVGGAGAFAILDRLLARDSAQRSKIALATISLLALAASAVYQLTSADTIWERPGYAAHYHTVESLSQRLDEMLLPEETLYVWDYQPGFYVLPDRRPPAGVFYNTHAMKGPLVKVLTERVMTMLETKPPEVVIIHSEELAKLNDVSVKMHPVYEWIRVNATQLEMKESGPFVIFVRKNGPLAKRLKME